jgi:RecB family exonuclease
MTSFSRRSCYNECPRKAYYRYEKRLAPLEPSLNLHAGSAGHAGIEALLTHGLDAVGEAVDLAWGDYITPAGKHEYLTAEWIKRCVRNYSEDTERDELELIHTEIEFDLTVKGVQMTGRIDAVWRDPLLNYLYPGDFKFTKQYVTDYWAKDQGFDLSHQLRMYVLACQELFPDDTVYGATVTGIHMGKMACDEDEQWAKRSSKRVMEFDPYTFSPDETLEWCQQIDSDMVYRQFNSSWPQNTLNKYGCGNCEFQELCLASPVTRKGEMVSNYKEMAP